MIVVNKGCGGRERVSDCGKQGLWIEREREVSDCGKQGLWRERGKSVIVVNKGCGEREREVSDCGKQGVWREREGSQ